MRIVITGGCGFLGRRLAQRLLERRDVDELVLFDNAPPALPLPEDERIALLTGVLGGYTTFSSFTFETFELLREGELWLGLANVLGSVILGLVAVWLGVRFAQLF